MPPTDELVMLRRAVQTAIRQGPEDWNTTLRAAWQACYALEVRRGADRRLRLGEAYLALGILRLLSGTTAPTYVRAEDALALGRYRLARAKSVRAGQLLLIIDYTWALLFFSRATAYVELHQHNTERACELLVATGEALELLKTSVGARWEFLVWSYAAQTAWLAGWKRTAAQAAEKAEEFFAGANLTADNERHLAHQRLLTDAQPNFPAISPNDFYDFSDVLDAPPTKS